MTVGKRIHDRRIEIGLSVDTLAEKIGKNRATVYRYESDDIENLPLSIIEALSSALKTTPAYLMGWESEQDEWTKSFCKSVDEELTLSECNELDCLELGINYYRLQEVSEGVNQIMLSEACDIANELGCSLDSMVGIETSAIDENTDKVNEFIELFNKLTEEQQNLIVSQIKGILSNQ